MDIPLDGRLRGAGDKVSTSAWDFGGERIEQPQCLNFALFGASQELGSKDQVVEVDGSMPMKSSIETWCDHRKWTFEDTSGEILSLLTDLAAKIHVGPQPQSDAISLILRHFNSEIFSAIIYYFRLLASAFLKDNSVTGQDFIPDGLGAGICKDMLEPLNTEIGNLGVIILIDVLMNPMGIAVEIVYLDGHGNSRTIRDGYDNGFLMNPAGPIVHLLYRPGDWEILYKRTNASRSLRQQRIIDKAFVASNNRASVFIRALDPSPMTDFTSIDPFDVENIPGLPMTALCDYGIPSTNTTLSSYPPTYQFDTSASRPNMQYAPPVSAVSPQGSGTSIVPPAAPSIHNAPSGPQCTRNFLATLPSPSSGTQFRHSKSGDESDNNVPSAQNFQTNIFKHSHYNTAHFNNPYFQPEEWSLDDGERSHASR